MKAQTAEKLVDKGIIAGRGENIRCFAVTVLWGIYTLLMVKEIPLNLLYRYDGSGDTFAEAVKVAVILFSIAWFLCPILFARSIADELLSYATRFYGYIVYVIIAMVICVALAVTVGFLAGLVIMLFKGLLRPLVNFIAMGIYCGKIKKINSLSGDMTPFLEDDKFLGRVDNISDSIDMFRSLGYVSEKAYDRFAEQYNMLTGFLTAREEYKMKHTAEAAE